LTAVALLGVSVTALRTQAPGPSAVPARQMPGPQPDGTVLLPNGWSISPAGKQVTLSTLPMSLAVVPDGKHALVLNAGFLPPTISVVDIAAAKETSRVPMEDAWLGLTFNKTGDKVYVGGGASANVFEFNYKGGQLSAGRVFAVIPPGKRQDTDFVGDIAVSIDGRFLYAANLFRDSVSVLNAQTGFVVSEFKTGRRPYRLLPNTDGATLLVSHWGEASVGLYNLAEGRLIERISTGSHPADMLLRPGKLEAVEGRPELIARLFVACANTNGVWVYGVAQGNRFHPMERVNVASTVSSPLGSTPTALELSADQRLLYVAASGNNAIVTADVSLDRAQLVGAIPTGWYPTAVASTGDGSLLYLSGKGNGSSPILKGPDPTRRGEQSEYVASRQTGSLGIVPPLSEDTLQRLTERVIANSPYDDRLLQDAGVPQNSPVPNRAGDPTPIQHVIYVVKENRTFDQVLGDIGRGNGRADLAVFGEDVTPNHHKLAREFTLLDNFYTNGDVSADGQNWSVAAIANDYVEKLWPSYYGGRRPIYDFEGGEAAAIPPTNYLWSNALSRGLSVRNYGFWTAAPNRAGEPARVLDPALAAHTDRQYAAFDLDTPDKTRVYEFLREFREFEAQGKIPKLMMVRLPGDHTAGRAPGKPTARAMMAEHDQALGQLVEAVSRSSAWPRTAIFIVEDDAQDGSDHVDAHRAPAFVISPYARRGLVDSTHYTTMSVLRTIELILGLQPMTQFDAAATPLYASFSAQPDTRPFEAAPPKVPLDEMNPAGQGGRPRRVEMRRPGVGVVRAFQ